MNVYLLYVGEYDNRRIVGVFATRELAERGIMRRALEGKSLQAVEIDEEAVVTD